MHLRQLKVEDAPLMLEWMHDDNIVKELYTDFSKKTINDCKEFIIDTQLNGNEKSNNLHYAIVSDEDVYMGTVSLKEIDWGKRNAEFAIVVRKSAMNRGYAWYGMKKILDIAFNELQLESVYWCVSKNNKRANRFYNKHNFCEALDIPDTIKKRYKGSNLKWYSALKGSLLDDRKTVAGCNVIHIHTIPTVDAGELSFFETNKELNFDIKRIYYISKVPEGVRRGFHAHKELKQLLFCPFGRIQLLLENNMGREEFELSDPSVGIIIDKPTWREMLWLQKDSVLCVAASDYYDEKDYIRDYKEFKKYISTK